MHKLGIHPNVHLPKEDEDDSVEYCQVFDAQHGYNGAVLHLEGQGEKGSETLEYEFDVNEKAGRPVYTEFGLIGRGTVIPDKARVTEASSSGQASEELVAKVAWPHAGRTGEVVFISKVRRRLEGEGKTNILQHIVEMRAALTKDGKRWNSIVTRWACALACRTCECVASWFSNDTVRWMPLDRRRSFMKFVQVVRGKSLTVLGLY